MVPDTHVGSRCECAAFVVDDMQTPSINGVNENEQLSMPLP